MLPTSWCWVAPRNETTRQLVQTMCGLVKMGCAVLVVRSICCAGPLLAGNHGCGLKSAMHSACHNTYVQDPVLMKVGRGSVPSRSIA